MPRAGGVREALRDLERARRSRCRRCWRGTPRRRSRRTRCRSRRGSRSRGWPAARRATSAWSRHSSPHSSSPSTIASYCANCSAVIAAHCSGVTTSAPRPSVAACGLLVHGVARRPNVVERISTLPLSACDRFAAPTTRSAAASAATRSTASTRAGTTNNQSHCHSSVGARSRRNISRFGRASWRTLPRNSRARPEGQPTTKLTMRPGTTTTLRTVAPVEQLGDPRVGPSGGLVVGLRRARGHGDLAPDLAVDLHRDLDGVVDQQRGIGLGEVGERERAGLTEPLPQLLGHVRRERREHQHHRPHDLTRRAPLLLHDPGESVVQLHQRRDRGVELELAHVVADRGDGAVQLAARLVVGRYLGDVQLAGVLVDDVAPEPLQELVHADDVLRAPRPTARRAGR